MRHYLMYRECKISEITKSSEKLRGFFMHKSQTFLSLGFVITQRSLFRYYYFVTTSYDMYTSNKIEDLIFFCCFYFSIGLHLYSKVIRSNISVADLWQRPGSARRQSVFALRL